VLRVARVTSLCIASIWTIPVLQAQENLRGDDDASKFELRDGERVVFLGNTLIERAQSQDYWETALATRWPNRKIVFRNLGWSGDTVFGQARAGFGDAAAGFAALRDEVLRAKPTVILLGYGGNEAFAGEAGREDFRRGLRTLLDALAPAKARIVLLTPTRLEKLGPPLPDPAEQNRNLELYCQDIREIAEERGLPVVDLFAANEVGDVRPKRLKLTYNGIHLSEFGYWQTAIYLEQELDLPPRDWRVEIEALTDAANVPHEQGVKIGAAERTEHGVRFTALDETLPFPRYPLADVPSGREPKPHGTRVLKVTGLPEGDYTLRIDRRRIVSAGAAAWARGIEINAGPEFDQAEELRQAIVQKNRLFFYRWRPQNETYLFGFRKHEQGQNAREIPMFDPLVEKQEAVIATLKKPIARYYELTLSK
jgi:hypothetical protein